MRGVQRGISYRNNINVPHQVEIAFRTKRAGSHVHDRDQEDRSDRVAHLLRPEFISVARADANRKFRG